MCRGRKTFQSYEASPGLQIKLHGIAIEQFYSLTSCIFTTDDLEVLIVVNKMSLVSFVHLSASLLNILGQTGRTTAKDADLFHLK